MEEDDQPLPTLTTSKQDQKKESDKSNSNTDVEKLDGPGSSQTSFSYTRSERSRLEIGQQISKAPRGKNERKPSARRRRTRRNKNHGRIEKRTLHVDAKRRRPHRSKRISKNTKERDESITSVLTPTTMSSCMLSCRRCPHCDHCCYHRRRFIRMQRSSMRKRKNLRRAKFILKSMATQTTDTATECVQAGSRCLMLSPLCLTTNASPQELVKQTEESNACEISPEIIYGALRSLTMWRQEVTTSTVLDYIKSNYPVGFSEQLLPELEEKLRIASIVGIVAQKTPGYWCLSYARLKRKLTLNHVTLFWKIYADSMKPVVKKP